MPEDHTFQIEFYEKILEHLPKDTTTIELLGHLYTQSGRIDEGLKMDQKLVKISPEDPLAQYNLACSLALKNRQLDAIKALEKAITLGYDDLNWLTEDTDLTSIQDHPRFQSILLLLKSHQ